MMDDEFAKTVEKIRRLQTRVPDQELIQFVTVLAELHNRNPDDVMLEFRDTDPVVLANSYYAQLNEEQAKDAIDAARRGDRSHLEERAEVGLTTPAEKPFLFGKKKIGRPPTMRTRDEWIVATIEALRATGLKKHVALAKAGREWGKHLNVSKATIEDIYKTDKLDAARAKALREFFSDATESDVIAAISDYCRNHK